MLVLQGGGGTGTRSKPWQGWPFCLAESWAEIQKSFPSIFYFSEEVQTKINATYVEV